MNTKSMLTIIKDENLCLTTNPQGTDKGSYKSYIEKFYEIEFTKYRDKHTTLMEIGFRHGASLALWSKYFNDIKIIGLDNYSDISVTDELPIVKEWIEQENIKVKIGDAYDQAFAASIGNAFDIIIDDGPHWLETQQKAIKLYLPKLNPDGVFIIEDILSGERSILALMNHVPLKYSAFFYQFDGSPDNSLFVVKHNQYPLEWLPNRVSLLLQFAKYVLVRIFYKILR